jgi:preprotein translocase subunit SecA
MPWRALFDFLAPGRRARLRRLAREIIARSQAMQTWSDAHLKRQAAEVRWQVRSGAPPGRVVPQAFALAREACRRAVQMAHFPVQIVGGLTLVGEGLAELLTGEGKTLTAVLPAALRAMAGRGCHVVTVNDYLAQRDANWMRPAYELLGLSVGCIVTELNTDQRRAQYACDVTYGTAKEFGFDFLRDRLRTDAASAGAAGVEKPVQRGHHFALVDEADSVLIDDARTPLIIALPGAEAPGMVELYRWCHELSSRLRPDVDFVFEPKKREVILTEQGCRAVLLSARPRAVMMIDTEQLYRQVEVAICARLFYVRDRDYLVRDDQVVIVDESTGRMMEGRKWQRGLHQAIEAQEQLPITPVTQAAAQITVQRYFRQYTHLAGMTGTAAGIGREARRNYRLRVARVPPHRPCIRVALPLRIFATWRDKAQAVLAEIEQMISAGRAVLVGTPSISASERLSELISSAGIVHYVLNARHLAREAQIVAQAGGKGRITIATNMAGRGTDIVLDEEVKQAGGLHVIATEMHAAARIDRQLIGRCARQGDPGSFRFFLSLEDELLRALPERELARIQPARGRSELSPRYAALFRRVQRRLERLHERQRKEMLKYEDQRLRNHHRMGLDPFLELIDEH